jgi:SAM-dependent methyltransferase
VLTKILHRVVQNPWFYDRLQRLVGLAYCHRRVLAAVPSLNAASFILDLGGGTGLYRNIWPYGRYICLDMDLLKLQYFLSKRDQLGSCLCADVARVPLRSGSVDVVTCFAVSHHLTSQVLDQLINESIRVLKDGGIFIFMDAVWMPRSLTGRLLWKYDRGASPRTAECLRSCIVDHYSLIHDEEFSVYHEYLLLVGVKHSCRRSG